MVVLANLFSCFFTAPSPNTLTVKKHPAIRLQATTTQTNNNSSNGQLELSLSTKSKLENASNNNSPSGDESFVKKSRSWRISFRRKSSSPNSDSTALPPLVNESKKNHLTLQSSKSTRTLQTQSVNSSSHNTTSSAHTNYARTRNRAKSKSTGSLMTTTQGYTPNVIPAVLKPGQSNQQAQQSGPKRKNPKENFKPVGSCTEKSAKLNLSLSTMPPLAVNASRKRPPGQTAFSFQEHTSQHFSKKHVNETFMDWIQTTDYYAKIERNLKRK